MVNENEGLYLLAIFYGVIILENVAATVLMADTIISEASTRENVDVIVVNVQAVITDVGMENEHIGRDTAGSAGMKVFHRYGNLHNLTQKNKSIMIETNFSVNKKL